MSRQHRIRLLENLPQTAKRQSKDAEAGATSEARAKSCTDTDRDRDGRLAKVMDLARSEDILRQQRDTLLGLSEKDGADLQLAEKASEAKSNFLSNMSHELRTPLNAIIGISEILLDDVRDAQQAEYVEPLERIHRAGEHLLLLINDILDISKIEAGRMTLWPRDIDVTSLVKEVVETFLPLAHKNGNSIEFRIDDIETICVDPLRVKQVLMNLASNACKFTQNGQVRIHVRREPGGGTPVLLFSVMDTGAGMAPDQLSKLFQEFMQADSARATQALGTGLGLAISRKLSRLMHGDIEVQSELGVGSTFVFRLPLTLEAGAGETGAAESAHTHDRNFASPPTTLD